eukprot:39847-Ditylum_brightwellii.AAC.1
MPGSMVLLALLTAAALSQCRSCLVVILVPEKSESACSKYSADNMPVSSVLYEEIMDRAPLHGP